MATLKTVKKWEEALDFKAEIVNIINGKVQKIKCVVCAKFENQIKNMKGYSRSWIDGTESIKKDSIEKHIKGEPHKYAKEADLKHTLGAIQYSEQVIMTSQIGRGITTMKNAEREVLRTRFNTAYYLCKYERPFSDFNVLLTLEEKNGMRKSKAYRNDRAAASFVDVIGREMRKEFVKDLLDARYYSLLTDGSTDTSILEQEVLYVLYLSKEGRPVVKFLSVETPEHAHAEGLKSCIEGSFQRLGILDMYKKLANFNVDGASVNTGLHNGLGVKLKESAPWLSVIHCFNHRLELSVKDAFGRTFFKEIDNMLVKLYYLYRKSPKRLRELQVFGEMYDQTIPKPYKSYGTRWIAHKLKAMEVVLQNYGIFIKHLESLAHTDSQALKRAEITGEAKKWSNAKFPIHLAIYLDVLTPLKVLSLGFQKEKHDPVTATRRICEFNWTMGKLQLLIDSSLDGDNRNRLTHFTKFLKEIDESAEGGKYFYQEIELKNFTIHRASVQDCYKEIITQLATAMEGRFEDIISSPVFKPVISILDVSKWPNDDQNMFSYCDEEIIQLRDHYHLLLSRNNCIIEDIPREWDSLKQYVVSMVTGLVNVEYLEIWSKIFTAKDITLKCSNVLHLIELLLITPFTNAKLERIFSRMNRIKTEPRNRLGQERLEIQLRVGEEGVDIADFNPDVYIDEWFSHKIRRFNCAKPHSYPSKRRSIASGSTENEVMDIAGYTLSDLESDDEDIEIF